MKSLLYLICFGNYGTTSVSLWQNDTCLGEEFCVSATASSMLIPLIQKILLSSNITLENLNFIAVEQGPGMFTSLRVLLSTVKGLVYKRNIPVATLDGFMLWHSYLQEEALNASSLVLLNACNKELYYSFLTESAKKTGYGPYHHIYDLCQEHDTNMLVCGGNGVSLYNQYAALQGYFLLKDYTKELNLVPVHTVARYAKKIYGETLNLSYHSVLQPLYLKTRL